MSDQPSVEWLDVEQAAQRAGLKSGERIRQLCKANQLEYRRPSYHRIEVNAQSLDKWIARRNRAESAAITPPAEPAPTGLLPADNRAFTLANSLQEHLTALLKVLDCHHMTTHPGEVDGVSFVWADGVTLTYDIADLVAADVPTVKARIERDLQAARPYPAPPRLVDTPTAPIQRPYRDLGGTARPDNIYDVLRDTPLPSTLGGQHKRTSAEPPPQDWQKQPGQCACAGCGHRSMSRHFAGGSLDPRKRYHGRLRCPVCRAAGCNVNQVKCHITIPDKAGDVL